MPFWGSKCFGFVELNFFLLLIKNWRREQKMEKAKNLALSQPIWVLVIIAIGIAISALFVGIKLKS